MQSQTWQSVLKQIWDLSSENLGQAEPSLTLSMIPIDCFMT
jgi:hypothetical protein